MTQTLAAMYEAHIVAAGPEFLWPVKGGQRPSSSYRGVAGFRDMFRDMLWVRQGGVCPVCADTMPRHDVKQGEINHLVSQGPERRGYFPGCVMLGHPACNTRCEREFGVIIPLDALDAPEVIPLEWPSLSDIRLGAR